MTAQQNRIIGKKRNKLLRYKIIKELYNNAVKEHPHTPLTKILSEYIRPFHPISRTTLYEILCTNVVAELNELENKFKPISEA